MVMNIASIPPDVFKDQESLAPICEALGPLLATYGESRLLTGLAYSVGLRRILDVLATQPIDMVCGDGDLPARSCVGRPLPAGDENPKASVKVVYYYVLGCNGAMQLAERLKRPIFKIGYLFASSLNARFAGLERQSYGGWAPEQAIANCNEPLKGWSKWRLASHKARDTAHLLLPSWISVSKGIWRLELPEWVDVEEFDRIVTAAMQSRQLAFWARSGQGRAHCARHNFDPEECVRYSRHETGVLRPVEEIYAYNPRRDAAWLATILIEAMAELSRRKLAA